MRRRKTRWEGEKEQELEEQEEDKEVEKKSGFYSIVKSYKYLIVL